MNNSLPKDKLSELWTFFMKYISEGWFTEGIGIIHNNPTIPSHGLHIRLLNQMQAAEN